MMSMLVKDLMSIDPVCVEPGATAISALDLMVDEGVRHLPVVDVRRYVVGVVSIDDLAAALPTAVSFQRRLEAPDRRDVCAVKVGELMSYAPDSVLSSTPAGEAARHMALKAIGCLPVVDEQGRLEGILSESDILEAYAAAVSGTEIDRTPLAESRDNRLAEALRAEAERLTRTLPLNDQIGPKLAVARLRSLEEALLRVEQGELHSCVRCKGRISANRLRALPGTTLCSRCGREVEW
jgi:acetoin utilization protein AcuB